MSWLKLDDGFAEHPKVLALSDAALRLHLRAMCWVARQETDGAIPAAALRAFHAKAKLVTELVASGLWEEAEVGDGHTIHDYLTYNPSRAKLEAERAATRERQQRFRNGVTNTVTDPPPGNGKSAPVTPLLTRSHPDPRNGSPVPTRPDPSPTPKKKSCQAGPDVLEVFEFWKQETGHPQALLDTKRSARIQARIREGATVSELKSAIRNRRNDPWLMGSSGKVYDGIETLLRDRSQVERLAALTSPPVPKGPAPGLVLHQQFGGRSDPIRQTLEAEAASETRLKAAVNAINSDPELRRKQAEFIENERRLAAEARGERKVQ